MQEVAEGVYRLGRKRHNFYLIVEGGRATVVDAGGSREMPLLEKALARCGLDLGGVEALLITHYHSDHVGFGAAADAGGVPVMTHRDEADAVRHRRNVPQIGAADVPLWRPRVWAFLAEMIRSGAHRADPIPGVIPLDDGETLDVPGRPTVVHTPGHTPGHAAYFLAGRRILLSGDALVTMRFLRGGVGPTMLEDIVHADPDLARGSLDRLAVLDAELLLPGHGPPWSGPMQDLVAEARPTSR